MRAPKPIVVDTFRVAAILDSHRPPSGIVQILTTELLFAAIFPFYHCPPVIHHLQLTIQRHYAASLTDIPLVAVPTRSFD
jgi:hypothetical protein